MDSGGESRLARLLARNRRYEAALARGRILAYLDERSLENELEGAAARRAPSLHDQAAELRQRLAVVR
jgi:hypothetical protein